MRRGLGFTLAPLWGYNLDSLRLRCEEGASKPFQAQSA
jgi:hypothetical protein